MERVTVHYLERAYFIMFEDADQWESGSRPAGSFCMATQKIPWHFWNIENMNYLTDHPSTASNIPSPCRWCREWEPPWGGSRSQSREWELGTKGLDVSNPDVFQWSKDNLGGRGGKGRGNPRGGQTLQSPRQLHRSTTLHGNLKNLTCCFALLYHSPYCNFTHFWQTKRTLIKQGQGIIVSVNIEIPSIHKAKVLRVGELASENTFDCIVQSILHCGPIPLVNLHWLNHLLFFASLRWHPF